MKLRAKFFLILFGALLVAMGVVLILYTWGVVNQSDIQQIYSGLEKFIPVRILHTSIGAIMILFVLLSLNFVWAGMEAERNIAFKTEHGEVLVTLSAIEEYIRRFLKEKPDIRDVRVKVMAKKISRKRGLLVGVKTAVIPEMNLPTLTEGLQEEVKKKIQEMLGLEEPVIIKIYISKIGEKTKKGKEEEEEDVIPPFREF
ncbi:MAG: alkaline shock response membrane anchor protein AmaP [Candidatus Omnitrophota bacterium]|nr:MAG: alkaline shock response membrane anchor protein AmaP [Candidatus Omnitrophota bacterium]